MPADLLIFVFERVSYGRTRPILAEFAPVPNAPSESDSTRADATRKAAVPAPGAVAVKGAVPTGNAAPIEIGGPSGPEPTRFGDWEKNGRCVDF
jgi:hypothetical protein